MPPAAHDPFGALRTALMAGTANGRANDETYPFSLDPGREERTGIPEVVFAPGKSGGQIVEAVRGLLAARGRVIVSRVGPREIAALRVALPAAAVNVGEGMRTARVMVAGFAEQIAGGRVGIVTAGTSDLPAADEAAVIARAMGCEARIVADVGVAGLHRLIQPLEALFAWGCDALVVAAGMDGALPSVVAGLAPVPVIGLPTMIGYGAGGRGEAALLSMLQTCAPGLVVVNIDNGIGAGVAAARIANQSAAAQRRRESVAAGGRPAAPGEQ
jgi:pyridinium-3,5-biscarboxylic acid mononucleotide synthase